MSQELGSNGARRFSPGVRSACAWHLALRRHGPRSAGLLAVILLPLCAWAQVASIDCPSTALQPGGSFVAEITIDIGLAALGAYTLALDFDENVAVIESVDGGTSPEFAGTPITNPAEFTTGRTRISAFNTTSLTSPTGVVSVARVRFDVVGTPGSSTALSLDILTLADPNGMPLVADTAGCTVTVASETPMPTPGTRTATPTPTPTATLIANACVGDCNHDGQVTIDELLLGASIALGDQSISQCNSFDWNEDGKLAIDEIVRAINMALNACPSTPTRTPSLTPTLKLNHPPEIPSFSVYHGYPGYEIRLPIDATDPDGDRLHYTAAELPEGAQLDELAGVLSWAPQQDQIGPTFVSIQCTDEGVPPGTAEGLLVFEISPLDGCTLPSCEPDTGCESLLAPVDQVCCTSEPQARVAQPLAACPEGRVVFVGRNNEGFGRLQNCDRLQVINSVQSGTLVRFHVEARCLNTDQPLSLHARLETKSWVLFDKTAVVLLRPDANGYAERLAVSFPVAPPASVADLEGAEAQFKVTLTDADEVVATEELRLTLTLNPLADLPEADDAVPPVATSAASRGIRGV